jgi:hypothetical protein
MEVIQLTSIPGVVDTAGQKAVGVRVSLGFSTKSTRSGHPFVHSLMFSVFSLNAADIRRVQHCGINEGSQWCKTE